MAMAWGSAGQSRRGAPLVRAGVLNELKAHAVLYYLCFVVMTTKHYLVIPTMIQLR